MEAGTRGVLARTRMESACMQGTRKHARTRQLYGLRALQHVLHQGGRELGKPLVLLQVFAGDSVARVLAQHGVKSG